MKRRDFLKTLTAASAASVLPAPAVQSPAKAQGRQETLLVVTEYSPNNFDIHGVGTNRPGYEVSWNCYDRLMSHGEKTLPDSTKSYDRDKFVPELAEDWNLTDKSVTFRLRKNAKFHDGTPVTAKDVKWSLDRAVSVGGFPTFQMKAGSLEKKEQFVVVDDHTVRIDFIRKDNLTMPDLAVIVPGIYNSELIKKHATEKDPWGLDYTKTNIAGGGAYKVSRWQAGSEVVFERNDDWKSGPLPKMKRIIWRTVPSAGNRRALIERGDADISVDLPNKDFAELKQAGKVAVVTNLIGNGIGYIGMNVKKPPFEFQFAMRPIRVLSRQSHRGVRTMPESKVPLLRIEEVSARLQLSSKNPARAVKRIVKALGTPYRRLGGQWRFTENDVAALVEAIRCSQFASVENSGTSEGRFGLARSRSRWRSTAPDLLTERLQKAIEATSKSKSSRNSSTVRRPSAVK
ncbi:MAG: twin-arginine translocation signal domain-containing protein [Sphingomonadales bacterium]|nr:twin-arginine translocation signal domain-containing protein [Sphingomonadales bacterium]